VWQKIYVLLNLIVGCSLFFLLQSGTFEAEDAKVVYGLTHPVNSFDPIMLQVLYFVSSTGTNVQKKLLF